MGNDLKASRPEREFLRGSWNRYQLAQSQSPGSAPTAAMAGLRPVQDAPHTPERGDSVLLGFLEGSAIIPRLNDLLRKADQRGILTNTNPIGVGIGVLGDAHREAIDRLRREGYTPAGAGDALGKVASAAMLAPVGAASQALSKAPFISKLPAAKVLAKVGPPFVADYILNQGAETPGGGLLDGIASVIGSLENRLPAVIDFQPQGRPETRRNRR